MKFRCMCMYACINENKEISLLVNESNCNWAKITQFLTDNVEISTLSYVS